MPHLKSSNAAYEYWTLFTFDKLGGVPEDIFETLRITASPHARLIRLTAQPIFSDDRCNWLFVDPVGL